MIRTTVHSPSGGGSAILPLMTPADYQTRISPRAKRLGLTVYPDRRVIVTVPRGTPSDRVHDYVTAHAGWIERQIASLRPFERCIFLPGGRRDFLRHRDRARMFVTETLRKFAPVYGLTFNRIAIKNLKSTWGSCSERGNLNFNYRLVHLPMPLAEYIVVHELCHLAEFNHSGLFWSLVARCVPDHKERRKALRSYLL